MANTSPQRLAQRYEVHGEIASGGMATVHYGRLVGAVGFSRAVAIKRLHPQFAKDPDFVAMFVDEARLAARIRHPNVVPVLDVVTEGGDLVLVLEYVHGESLSALLRLRDEGRAPEVSVVVSILVGVLNGLHAAHEASSESGEPLGIVHRDVSPQNVIVGVDGVARVLDFGVAKATSRMQSTAEGQVKGKIAYMAPEQLDAKPVDRRTDVYAAGVVLWEALAGRRLFSAESTSGVLMQILQREVEAPSRHNPDVRPALDAVVAKALAREPSRRFATADEMAAALERSTRVAAAREVGEWVSASVGRMLGERAAAIDGMEALSVPTEKAAAPSVSPPGPAAESSAITSLSSATTPAMASRARLRNAGLVLVALASAGGLYVWLASTPGPLGGTDRASPASEAPARADDSAPAPVATSTAAVAPSESTDEPVAANSPHDREPPRSSRQRPNAPAPARRGQRAGVNCSPPYTVGADGVKRFKPECVD